MDFSEQNSLSNNITRVKSKMVPTVPECFTGFIDKMSRTTSFEDKPDTEMKIKNITQLVCFK